MLIEEATWLNKILQEIGPGPGSTLLDIGSSTEYFRRVEQPYIDYYIFWPLRKKGIRIIHVDARTDEGVDIVCDISDPASHDVEKIPPADIVLCSNLLEHVLDREMVAARLALLTKPGGHLIVTVPHVYRYHEDPIDTLYRPTNKELEALLKAPGQFQTLRSEILDVSCGYLDAPTKFLPYLLFRAKRFARLSLLRRPVKFDRCKVSAVVLKKAAT